jgi:hypothetical protein
VALSALGYAVAAFSALLGGHLSFGRRVGVNQTAFEDVPEQWTAVLGEDGLEKGKLTGAQANGVTVLLVRKEDPTPLCTSQSLGAWRVVRRTSGCSVALPAGHAPHLPLPA